MTRQEKIVLTFVGTFSRYADKKIILYGTGSYTQWIINNCKEIPIAGLMDRWISDGEKYGKPVLAYPDVLRNGIDIIIISASAYNTELIKKRIADFCDDNAIMLFDLEGKRLNSGLPDLSFMNKRLKNRFHDCEEMVITKIDKAFWKPIEEHFRLENAKTDSIGRIIIYSGYDIGYLFLGALVSDFLFWMMHKIKMWGAEEVIFTARDGYLFKKLYDKIRHRNTDLPRARYLLTSRNVCIASGIDSFDDILRYSRINFSGESNLLLKERFFLKEEEIAGGFPKMTKEEILEIHEDRILNRVSEIRKWYLNYLTQEDMIRPKKRVIFDLIASGTCQQVLEKLLTQSMYGLYMLRMYTEDQSKKKLNIDSYHPFEEEFARRSMFMECILTSFQPTLKYIGKDGMPVYAKESRVMEELAFVKEVQEGIEGYFDQVVENMEKEKYSYEYSRIPLILYNHVTSHYSVIENEVFKRFILKDEVFGERNWLLHKIMV